MLEIKHKKHNPKENDKNVFEKKIKKHNSDEPNKCKSSNFLQPILFSKYPAGIAPSPKRKEEKNTIVPNESYSMLKRVFIEGYMLGKVNSIACTIMWLNPVEIIIFFSLVVTILL